MTVPTYVKVSCVLETGKEYPVTKDYSAEDYILDTMAYNVGCKVMNNIPICVEPSEVVLGNGLPESFKYTAEAYLFTKAELDNFVTEVRKAVHFDNKAYELLNKCSWPIN